MAVILYLSNQLVQVVEAKNNKDTFIVQKVWQGMAPEGSIINGIITDEEAFLGWMTDFFASNKISGKEVELVINSTQFNHKLLEFPKIKEAEIKKMIPREFAENRGEHTLFSYFMFPEDASSGQQSVLAVGVEKEFLLSYINLFAQAGMEVLSVESGIVSLVKMFMSAPEISGKTCLMQVIDGQEVISMLFVKGRYYYSQKKRFFDRESATEQAGELQVITDKLLQFVTSQQIKEPVEGCYLCGAGTEELLGNLPQYSRYEGRNLVQTEKQESLDEGFIYPMGSLLYRQQKNSFFRQLKPEQEGQRKKREMLLLAAPSLAVLLICLVITILLGSAYLASAGQLNYLQKVLQDSETVNAHDRYELSAAEIENINGKITAIETIWAHLMSYPTIDAKVEEVLLECAGTTVDVRMKSFQRDSGTLTLNATAKDIRAINGFVTNLQQQEMFEAVDYSGYSYLSGPDCYNIHVTVSMAEGAGRGEDK